MAPVFYFPLLGTPTAEGNQLWFYEAGLDVPLDVWTDSDLTIPWAQPIVFNAAAEADGPIYVSDSPSYKVVYKDANGVAIAGYPVDFVAPSTIINVTTVATTVLTNAQVKALPTTPITLVAAPAAGLRVKLLGATLRTAFTAGAYTNVNTTFATLGLQDPSADWLSVQIVNDSSLATDLTDVTTVLGASALVVDLPVPYVQAIQDVATTGHTEWINPLIGMATANVNGTALVLAMDNNGSGALTGGNAANTMTVIVYYALESVV